MKRFFKLFGILVLIVLIAILLIPFAFKNKIVDYVKEDINRALVAKIDFEDVSLNLFRNFPNLNMHINDLSINGIDDFKGVHLAQIDDLDLVLDLKSVFKGESIEVKDFTIDKGMLNILVTPDGKANYDINKPGSETDSTHFNINLNAYKLKDMDITYHDESLNFMLLAKGLNHNGKGNFNEQNFTLKTTSDMDTLTLVYGGVPYLNKVRAKIDTDLLVSEAYSKYEFEKATAMINDLPISAHGYVKLDEEDIIMDINYEAEQATLKHLLSLIPKEYLPDMKSVETDGLAVVKGYVKGVNNADNLPGFHLDIDLKNGVLSYPSLPEKVQNINLKTIVDFKGGNNLDKMLVELPSVHLDIAQSPVDGSLKLTNLISDPLMDVKFKSDLNLQNIQQAIKYEQLKEINGQINADFAIKGSLSAFENQKTDLVQANGYVDVKNFEIKTDAIDQNFRIDQAHVTVTPSHLKLNDFKANIGENDMELAGQIQNYLTYFLGKSDNLKGDFNMKSHQLNLNDFMEENSNEEVDNELAVIRVPKNIDITFNLQADKLIYKDMELNNASGKLTLSDEKAVFKDIVMDALQGKIKLNGVYDTKQKEPVAKLAVNLDQVDIQQSVGSLSIVKNYAPIFQRMKGKLLSNLNLEVSLDEHMNPHLNTVNAEGFFKSDDLSSETIDILKKIGNILKVNEFDKANFEKLKASFHIQDGVLSITPNQFTLNEMKAGIQGSYNLQKEIDFLLTVDVPKQKLGNNINSVLQQLTGKLQDLNMADIMGETIKTQFHITGSALNPNIKPSLLGSEGASLKETLTNMVENKVIEVKNDALEKAQMQADNLIKQAEQQKQNLINEAQKLADKTKIEANKAGVKLVQEAGNNPLKKLAAQTAAQKLNKEADKKSIKLVEKAGQKGDSLIAKARLKADELIKKAKAKDSL